MECRSVLVIDEDKDVRTTLQEALEVQGYVVHTAISGQEALEFLDKLPQDSVPGCIIMDLAIPIINGPEFLKHIETCYKNEFGDIPIIVTSANLCHVDTSDINLEDRMIKQPISLNLLYEAVGHHCRFSQNNAY